MLIHDSRLYMFTAHIKEADIFPTIECFLPIKQRNVGRVTNSDDRYLALFIELHIEQKTEIYNG